MIYSDEELKSWWDSYSDREKQDIFEVMIERSSVPSFPLSLRKQWAEGKQLSTKQLACIRKWDE